MLTCEVTYVAGIDNFSARLGSDQDFDEFLALELAISTYCENHLHKRELSQSVNESRLGISTEVSWGRSTYAVPSLATLFIRRIIFVQLKEPPDNNAAVKRPQVASTVWCRARVEHTNRETEEVEVYLLDYGWRLTTSVRSVVVACPDWMLVFPAFAHQCCLSGFDQGMTSDPSCLSEAVETFRKTVIGQRMAAQYDPAGLDCNVRRSNRRRVSLWTKCKQRSDDSRICGTRCVENAATLMPVVQLVLGNADIKSTNAGLIRNSDHSSRDDNTVKLSTYAAAVHTVAGTVQSRTGSINSSHEKSSLQHELLDVITRSPEPARLQQLRDSLDVKPESEREPSCLPTGGSAAGILDGTSGDILALADAAAKSGCHLIAARRPAELGGQSLGITPERFTFLPVLGERGSNGLFELGAERQDASPSSLSAPPGPDGLARAVLTAASKELHERQSTRDCHTAAACGELPVHCSSVSDGNRGSLEQCGRSDYLFPRSRLDDVAQPRELSIQRATPMSKGRGFRAISITLGSESRPGGVTESEPAEHCGRTTLSNEELNPDDLYGERFVHDGVHSNQEKATCHKSAQTAEVRQEMASGDGSLSGMMKSRGLDGEVVQKKVDDEIEPRLQEQEWKSPTSAFFGVNQVCVLCGSTEHQRCGTAKDLFID